MKKWTSNQVYPNMFFKIIHNEIEYYQAARELFDEFPVLYQWSVDQWEEKIHLFDDDYEDWHLFFQTSAMDYNDETDGDDLPDPKTFKGEIGNKPDNLQYPAILMFTNEADRILLWQSIDEIL